MTSARPSVRIIDLPGIEVLPVTFAADCVGKITRLTKANCNYRYSHRFERSLAFEMPDGKPLVIAATLYSRVKQPNLSAMMQQMFNLAQSHANQQENPM